MQLKVREAAKLLGTSENTVYRWIRQGAIPVYQVNEQFRFNRAEILEWATSRRIGICPDAFLETEASDVALPSLSGALRAGGIAYEVGGHDKPSVLRSVVEVMTLPEEVDREFLYEVLLARESLGSTAIGSGIAIPHVRNPMVLHVTEPMITLCFLQNPINFGALDGLPVTILFAMVSPTIKSHLHMLSRLHFILRHPEFEAALKQRASRDNLLNSLNRAESALPAVNHNGFSK